jgi:voltage-gated potassium channel
MSEPYPSEANSGKDASFRAMLYRRLDPSAQPGGGLSFLNSLIIGLILAATLLAIVETEPAVQERIGPFLSVLEIVFALLFTVEYLCRVYAAGENPHFKGWRGRLRYIFSLWAIIDLIAILPYYITIGGHNAFALRLLRILRILRLARLGRFSEAWMAVADALASRKYELFLASGVAALLLVFSSSLLYLAEASTQPETFGSIPRVMWWSVATLTTVGYGDVTPITTLGRIMAGATALSGIGLIAMPTGIFAAALSDAFQRQRKDK